MRSGPAGPTPAQARNLSPDVSRGLVLLGIAIANVLTVWLALGGGPGDLLGARPESTADNAVAVGSAMLVHQRGLPMFSALLAYGMGLLLTRERQRGTPFIEARNLLLRRYGVLAAMGAVHMIFLFMGDILVAYGLIGIGFALLALRASDRILLRTAWIILGLLIAGAAVALVAELALRTVQPELAQLLFEAINEDPLTGAGTGVLDAYWMQLLLGLIMFVSTAFGGFVFQFIAFAPVMLIGFVAGRRLLLNDPVPHLPLLRKIGYGGIAVSLAGGLVVGLMTIGALGDTPWLWTPMVVSLVTGLPAGLATVALITLLCRRWQGGSGRPPVVIQMLQALGQRSLSGYLFQSVAFLILMPPFALGLATHLSMAGATAVATGVWLVSLVGAWLLAKAGRPGPAESMHRRMVYGAPAKAAASDAPTAMHGHREVHQHDPYPDRQHSG